jgi:hypothetical protein
MTKRKERPSEKRLRDLWEEKLKAEGLGVLKGTYVSSKSFWRLDISRRTKSK